MDKQLRKNTTGQPKLKKQKKCDDNEILYNIEAIDNPLKRIDEYMKLAINGNENALLKVADMYYYGDTIERDIKKVIEMYKIGREKKFSKCILKLGILYKNGMGIKKNISKAKKLFRESVNLENADAMVQLALLYEDEDNSIESVELYRRAKELGNETAYGHYMRVKMFGIGCDKNIKEVKEMCVFKSYNPTILIQCAYMLYKGEHYERNLTLAYELYDAAKQNAIIDKDFDSLVLLGKQYETGYGIIKDVKCALSIYKTGVSMGSIECMIKLANLYRNSVEFRDYTKAISMYTLAETFGFIEAKKEIQKITKEKIKYDLKQFAELEGGEKTLEDKILELNISEKYKMIIYERYKMESKPTIDSKMIEWFDHVVKIPFGILNNIKSDDVSIGQMLINVRKKLDEKLFGMNRIKEELMMILNNKLRTPQNCHNTIALVGSPGVGKTAIILALCNALNLPFYSISMGGKKDAAFFTGHDFTWQGSQPGVIISALQSMKCCNGIIFFDEVDKLTNNEQGMQVSNFLLHITDFTQNHRFIDEYIKQIPVDLSHIWFIFSMNDENKLDATLRNRMTIVNVDGYNNTEKYNIIKNYTIPKFTQELHLENDLIFTDDIIEYIVKKTEKEEGVREVERNIKKILDKINILKSYNESKIDEKLSFHIDNFKLPLQLTKNMIDIFMNHEKINEHIDNMLYM
jgi:TPR repeat protein